MTWNTSGLSPGVYFYRLELSGASLSRRIVLLR